MPVSLAQSERAGWMLWKHGASEYAVLPATTDVTDARATSAALCCDLGSLRGRGSRPSLIAQDTTYFNFTGHEGLGPIESLHDQGILVHSAPLTTDGVPLGVVAQKTWVRDARAPDGGSRRSQEKERYRWIETQDAVAGVPSGTQPILVSDRESDVFDVFVDVQRTGYDVLVGAWDRRLVDHPVGHLWAAVAGLGHLDH